MPDIKKVVLAPKTDRSVWFWVDFRNVNAVSQFYAYPMPHILAGSS